jgi:hypothetical protein
VGPAREVGPLPVALTNNSIQMLKIYLLPVKARCPRPPAEGLAVTSGMTTGGRMAKYRHDGNGTTTGPACQPVLKQE